MRSIFKVQTRLRLLAIAFFTIVICPELSMADEVYEFLKMECHPESKSVSIKMFYDENESGRARIVRHEKDTYDLENLSGKPITCDLDDHQKVTVQSYIAHRGLTDNVSIDTPNARANGIYYLLGGYGFDFDFKLTDDGKYDSKYCSKYGGYFSSEEKTRFIAQFKEHKKVCKITESGHITYSVEGASIVIKNKQSSLYE